MSRQLSNMIFLGLILPAALFVDSIVGQNEVLAQGSNITSPTRDPLSDSIIPLATGLGGAAIAVFDGYRLSNRSQFKFNKINDSLIRNEV